MKSSASIAAPLRFAGGAQVVVNGRRLAYFGGCDYLGLSRHPALARAAAEAMREGGLSAGASRLTTGNRPQYSELEEALAAFFGAPTATLLPTGYTATLAAAQALAESVSHAFVDERAHHALHDAARLLGAKVRAQTFRHRDAADLARRVRRAGPRARPLVLTDGMFAYNGELAPLRDYFDALPQRAVFLVDDAHAAGALGARGRGTPEHWKIKARERARIAQVISLSKAFGAGGGAVLGGTTLRETLVARSRIFAGGTPLAPGLAAAALAAVRLMRRQPLLLEQLRRNIVRARAGLSGAQARSPSPIIALLPRGESGAAAWRARLLGAGIFPSFIRYAGGPAGGYFRLAVSAAHSPAQIRALASVLAQGPKTL